MCQRSFWENSRELYSIVRLLVDGAVINIHEAGAREVGDPIRKEEV